MKRSELYAKVWQTPLSKLGPELGVSDVGLAKLCRRHGIPTPPIGYWAQVAAGQTPRQPALPTGAEVDLRFQAPRSAEGQETRNQLLRVAREAKQAVATPEIEVQPTLEGCHPLVAKTAKFFNGILPAIEKAEQAAARARARREPTFGFFGRPQTECGRYEPGEGYLHIAATLTHINWTLRFHDALIRALVAHGCTVQTGADQRLRRVEVQKGDEAVGLAFAEEYDKAPKKGQRSAPSQTSAYVEWEYTPKDTFKLKMKRQFGGLRLWVGTAATLEEKLPEIVREFLAALEAQRAQREILNAEEAARRVRQERYAEEGRLLLAAQEAANRRQAARRAQIDRARALPKAIDEHVALMRLIEAIERRVTPEPGDDGLRTWLSLVKSGLSNPLDALLNDIRRESTGAERPLWWPKSSASDNATAHGDDE